MSNLYIIVVAVVVVAHFAFIGYLVLAVVWGSASSRFTCCVR
jgi:hypothetical protein